MRGEKRTDDVCETFPSCLVVPKVTLAGDLLMNCRCLSWVSELLIEIWVAHSHDKQHQLRSHLNFSRSETIKMKEKGRKLLHHLLSLLISVARLGRTLFANNFPRNLLLSFIPCYFRQDNSRKTFHIDSP